MFRASAFALLGLLVACAPHLRGFPDGSSLSSTDSRGAASGAGGAGCHGTAEPRRCESRSQTPLPGVPAMEHLARLYEMAELEYKPMERGAGALLRGAAPSGLDLLVLPGRDRKVRALDTLTGEVVWSVETLGINVAAPVRIGDDVIVASLDGTVRRLSARNALRALSRCLLYTSPSPRDLSTSRMPASA